MSARTIAAPRIGTSEADLKAAVAARIGETRFGLWFGDGVRLGVDGDDLVVGVPNGFFREWIESHFTGSLAEAAEAVAGRPLRLAFQVAGEGPPSLEAVSEAPVVIAPQSVPVERSRISSRPARRLEEFVTGPGSRLAHAAAVEMAATAGSAFNPLTIHGGVGLGKSHLLEGIGAALRARHAGMRLVQTTAETFTNGFLDALRTGGLPAFRTRYRGAGGLILDDAHFLAAKRATQDEFLHTFNTLTAEGAPIVLAMDQHPRLVAKLTDELVTRFLGGMVVKLEAPDPATRRAILEAKSRTRGVEVPEPVLAYVAEHLRGSVRELEGALNSLIAHAVLVGKRIDLTLAKTALRDTVRHTAQAVALKDIERAVNRLFGIEPEQLRGDDRSRAVAHPRMLAIYLARKHTGAAYSEIGRYFGGRNHSTVISAEKKVVGWLRDEERNKLLAGFETISEILAAVERELGA
jgi:chromosomal replication initiator protein